MFGLGAGEIIVILALALIVLGPQKLPELAKQLARLMGELRKVSDEVRRNFDEATREPPKPYVPVLPQGGPGADSVSHGHDPVASAAHIDGTDDYHRQQAAASHIDGTDDDPRQQAGIGLAAETAGVSPTAAVLTPAAVPMPPGPRLPGEPGDAAASAPPSAAAVASPTASSTAVSPPLPSDDKKI